MSTNYFQLEFDYPGPYGDIEDEAANAAIGKAEREWVRIVKAMPDSGTKFLHAYCFPDGSFYKFVRTDKSETELKEYLRKHLEGSDLCLQKIYIEDPTDDPYKVGCDTLKEYFDKNEKSKTSVSGDAHDEMDALFKEHK